MVRIKLLLILWIAASSVSFAQVNRYMVFFADKQGNGHSVNNPITFLNQRSIDRRAIQNIDIVVEDLPVTASYIQSVRATGASVLYKTKWMNGVLVECTATQLAVINALAFVKSSETEFVAPGSSGERKSKSNKLKVAGSDDDETADQLAMLGVDEMHADGYTGEDVIIAVMDGGFIGVNTAADFQDVFNNQLDLDVSWDFTAHSSNVFKYGDHGTGVLSVIAVNKPGEFVGGAYKATFQLYVTENVSSEYRVEEYNWLFAAERADSSGVDVINTSLGYNTFDHAAMNYEREDMDGNTAVITRAAQLAASKGIFMVNSAGNSGSDASWRIITAPADGKNVLAVGNINVQGMRSPTSSIGFEKGHIKPDVVALGTGVSAYFGNGTIGNRNGTSFSSPLIAGLVGGLRQRYPELKSSDLMDAIRYSASQAPNPDNLLGYGIPHYRAIVNYLEMRTNVGKRSLVIYPNPVKDTFTLALKKPSEMQLSQASIVNAQGQTMAANQIVFNWPDNTYIMDISHFIPGVYFLTIRVGKKFETYKLVKI